MPRKNASKADDIILIMLLLLTPLRSGFVVPMNLQNLNNRKKGAQNRPAKTKICSGLVLCANFEFLKSFLKFASICIAIFKELCYNKA